MAKKVEATLLLILMVSAITVAQQPQASPSPAGRTPWVVSVVHEIDTYKLLERMRERQSVRVGMPGSVPKTIMNVVTGLVVDDRGHIVTRLANLDPEDKDQKISITTSDGYSRPAQVIGVDYATGFAVLQVESLSISLPDSAIAAAPANKAEVKILSADFVPKAVASEKRRQIYIEPSIKISSGNVETESIYSKARGALTLYSKSLLSRNDGSIVTNSDNQIVGIAQYAGFGRAYLFPVELIRNNIAKRVIEKKDNVPAGWLGAVGVGVAQLPLSEMESLGLKDRSGVIIREVVADGPAAIGGMQPNDVIVGLEGYEVMGTADLSAMLSSSPAGRSIRLKAIRERQPVELSVVLGARDYKGPSVDSLMQGEILLSHREILEKRLDELGNQYRSYIKETASRERNEALRELEIEIRQLWENLRGLQQLELDQQRLRQQNRDRQEVNADNQGDGNRPQNPENSQDISFPTGFVGFALTPQLAAFFGVTSGTMVKSVDPVSAADKAGIKAGDVIVGAQGGGPLTAAQLKDLLSKQGEPIILIISRNKQPLVITIIHQ